MSEAGSMTLPASSGMKALWVALLAGCATAPTMAPVTDAPAAPALDTAGVAQGCLARSTVGRETIVESMAARGTGRLDITGPWKEAFTYQDASLKTVRATSPGPSGDLVLQWDTVHAGGVWSWQDAPRSVAALPHAWPWER